MRTYYSSEIGVDTYFVEMLMNSRNQLKKRKKKKEKKKEKTELFRQNSIIPLFHLNTHKISTFVYSCSEITR